MLASFSKTLRVGKMTRLFCSPVGGAAASKFGTFSELDGLVKKIDGDKPYVYCLLVTESWNPL